MNDNNLQVELVPQIEITPSVSCVLIDMNSVNNKDYIAKLDATAESMVAKHKTVFRTIECKLHEATMEYSNIIKDKLKSLNVDYKTNKVLLAIDPSGVVASS